MFLENVRLVHGRDTCDEAGRPLSTYICCYHEGFLDGQDMGSADWRWEPDLGCHVPGCTVVVESFGVLGSRRCGNGPLLGEQIMTGDCGEH